ncbi:MAG: type II toxin-antitoxin system HipA family toxin [Lachnospiraceae bacterium]|nr:type II toxin-antitoxin system HipA family toxin [Lachnospiraceae bacterium]
MKTGKSLQVFYGERQVGVLALIKGGLVAFEYNDEWIKEGFAISPFSLPLEKRVFVPTKPYFSGLFGVFADSLPDAWGNVLVNRVLKRNGINPGEITVLDRLAIVGSSGMGALTYRPEYGIDTSIGNVDLDKLALECKNILQSKESDELDNLYRMGGTSGGARPKIMTDIDGQEWIIKFPAHVDNADVGKMEYDYSLCAKECSIDMTDTRIFPSNECKGYFGTERFDRVRDGEGIKKIHMLTVAAILEIDYNAPSLDYHSLMKLTKILTHDSKADLENMFLRMCFNVFAHNRDDHAKNFTFIYDEAKDMWRLAPAYDLTYSNTYYGEHTTSVDGNGSNPSDKELIRVGMQAGMSAGRCKELIKGVKDNIYEMLGEYL